MAKRKTEAKTEKTEKAEERSINTPSKMGGETHDSGKADGDIAGEQIDVYQIDPEPPVWFSFDPNDLENLLYLCEHAFLDIPSASPAGSNARIDDLLQTLQLAAESRNIDSSPIMQYDVSRDPKDAMPALKAVERLAMKLRLEILKNKRQTRSQRHDEQLIHPSRSGADGPCPPNLLHINGQRHELSPRLWRLLRYMWGRSEAQYEEVAEHVFGEEQIGDATIRSAVSKLNNELRKVGALCLMHLSCKAGYVVNDKATDRTS